MKRSRVTRLLFLIAAVSPVLPARAAVHEVIHNFTNPPQSPGAGSLVPGPDSTWWGTSESGGTFSCGTIYRVNTTSGEVTTVVEFSGNSGVNIGSAPRAALAYDGQGSFWGSTNQGGAFDKGTVFKIDATTGVLTTLASFTENGLANKGANPQGGLVSDGAGNFWGTTQYGGSGGNGTVFKISAATGVLTTVIEFTGNSGANKGANPLAGLVPDGSGLLWGTTSAGGNTGTGTIFKIDPVAGTLVTAVQLGSGNAGPQAALVPDGAGFLWSTSQNGGAGNAGTIFKVEISTSAFTSVYALPAGHPVAALARDAAGGFWGTTPSGGSYDAGTIFRFDPASGIFDTRVEFTGTDDPYKGASPLAALTADAAGNLLGTTNSGGTSDIGTIFSINANTGVFNTIAECHRDQGSSPNAGLTPDGEGFMWGTATNGGADDAGTVYKINPTTGQFISEADLPYSGGANPYGDLMRDEAGVFWGTAQNGGDNGKGSVFTIDPSGEGTNTIYSFTSFNGGGPYAGLTPDGNGCYWGVTTTGGSTNVGTVYKVDSNSGNVSQVLSFTIDGATNKGAKPRGGLTPDGNGFLWGTTQFGGGSGNGTVFKIEISTGLLTTLVSFTSNDTVNRGAWPMGKLVADGEGYMWGTTNLGDTITLGTVFKVNIATGVLTTVMEFTGTGGSHPGSHPIAGLTADGQGNFWGTTSTGGAGNFGTIFEINASSGAFSTITEFTGTGNQVDSGENPSGALVLAADGRLYGTTSGGGTGGLGTIFRISPGASPFQEWQALHFGSTTMAEAASDADPDEDGTDNLTEFRLGLDPLDSTSSFRSSGSLGATGYTLVWPSAPGVTFEVQRSTTLSSGWTSLTTVIGIGTYTDPNPPAGKAFYRVVLRP